MFAVNMFFSHGELLTCENPPKSKLSMVVFQLQVRQVSVILECVVCVAKSLTPSIRPRAVRPAGNRRIVALLRPVGFAWDRDLEIPTGRPMIGPAQWPTPTSANCRQSSPHSPGAQLSMTSVDKYPRQWGSSPLIPTVVSRATMLPLEVFSDQVRPQP
jgi:hypothetical protein